jgi:glycosyltransferase involved in cell wall biosynthesis
MTIKRCLIISPLPLKPVTCGMQNTVYLLYKYLILKKYDISFFSIRTDNIIDPVVNLKYKKYDDIKLRKKINSFKPNIVFVNTSKVLNVYKNILLDEYRIFKIILVCHDLYFFRKKYFNQINIKDKTPLSKADELEIFKKINFAIDFSKEEFRYLVNNGINRNKLIKTLTPTNKFTKLNINKKKKYDILYIASNWLQNKINFEWFLNKLKYKNNNYKILVTGSFKDIKLDKTKVVVKKYSRFNLGLCKLGVALIKSGSGRKVKIFEMLASGIPVITNLNLSQFDLTKDKHYIYLKNIAGINNQVQLLLKNHKLRKKISINAYKWSRKKSYYIRAFTNINNFLV